MPTTNWKSHLTRWQPHREGGSLFSITHLHPFSFTLDLPAGGNHPARAVEIRVGFSNHTFTRSWAAGDVDAQRYANRIFCHTRYPLSFSLPAIVRDIGNKNCFYAGQDNYMIVEAPNGIEYWVFFDVRHVGEPNTVLLFVQSAYPAGGLLVPSGRRRKKVGFNVLVNLALQAKRPTPPP